MSAKIAATIILVFILIGVLLGAGFVCLVSDPKLLSNTAFFLLKQQHSSDIVFKEITLEDVVYFSKDKMTLKNLRVKCKIKGVSYFFSTGYIDVDNLRALIYNGPVHVNVHNLAVVSDSLNISDAQLINRIYIERHLYHRLETILMTPLLEWNEYSITKVHGSCFDQNRLDFSNLHAHLYGGEILLKGILDYIKGFSYNFTIDLHQVDSSLVAQQNPSFKQLTALVDGTINIKNSKEGGMLLQADLKAPAGGSMKASLLRYMAQYVPQRKQMEDLIAKDADVSLSKAQARIISISSDKISSEVILNSSSLNLNMDVKFDIHLEGGIESLLEYIHQ